MHFIITLAHIHPKVGGESRRTSLQHKKQFLFQGAFPPSNWGLFLHVKGLFSPFFGGRRALLFFLHCFWEPFSPCGVGHFSPYVESFSGLFSLTKISAGAHALAARV